METNNTILEDIWEALKQHNAQYDTGGGTTVVTISFPNGESYQTPVYNFGASVTIDEAVLSKITAASGEYGYYLTVNTSFKCQQLLTSTFSSATTDETLLGYLNVPADALRWSGKTKVAITITADKNLVGFSIRSGLSQYLKPNQRISRYVAAPAATSMTMEYYITPQSASRVLVEQVSAGTAPTTLSNTTGYFDFNTLANVSIPIYGKFNAVVADTITITGIDAAILINAPTISTTTTRKATSQPFPSTDWMNKPLTDGVVYRDNVLQAYDPATTSSTVNARGTAGESRIWLYSTTGIKVGMYVAFVKAPVAGKFKPWANYFGTDDQATINAIGNGTVVTGITDGNYITISNPVLTDFVRQGTLYGVNYLLLGFLTPQNWAIRYGAGSMSQYKTPFGGWENTASDKIAAPWYDAFPIVRAQDDDPIRTFSTNNLVAPNAWLFKYQVSEVLNYGEQVKTSWQMRCPEGFSADRLATYGNADHNCVFVTPDGRYAVELYYSSVATDGTVSCSRAVVNDLQGPSYDYILNDTLKRSAGLSCGTRADGGGLYRGLITLEDVARIPDYSSSTTETLAEITDRVDQAMTAIPHACPMVMAQCQLKSYRYGSASYYKAFISQLDADRPTVLAGGTGYAVGDVLYVTAGVSITPMRLTVTSVSSGVVTGVFVSDVGMYITAPTDAEAAALATSTSGAGTGCTINALALAANPAVTSAATAFPQATKTSAYAYPATIADSVWSTKYNGAIQMGSWFTIPRSVDLRALWIAGRTATPTDITFTYEFLALLTAYQRYGGFVCDITNGSDLLVVADNYCDNTRLRNMLGYGSAVYKNLAILKNMLLYIENIQKNKVFPGTALAATIAEV